MADTGQGEAMTTIAQAGSRFLWIATFVISQGCGARSDADPAREISRTGPARVAEAPHAAETCLGVGDNGVFADLDPKVQLALPAKLEPARVSATVDRKHAVLVLAIDGFPRKAYPLGGGEKLSVGAFELALRPGDRAELAPLLAADRLTEGTAAHDGDGDGIPDPLDVLIGAKKTALNADSYTEEAEEYIAIKYPGGDVDRSMGVCTDVVVRAVRNAGHDLQKELHEDIRRAKTAYPMVKGMGDANIDQRRVGTLLPYFKRHWEKHSAKLDDPSDPLRPGDVILMDTFPSRSGPDHIGILSDTLDGQGLPLVINNWTNGTVTSEMDLLTFVPVMYRFRLPP
jgi:uncharacterized protein YijF (DUF1287 family)